MFRVLLLTDFLVCIHLLYTYIHTKKLEKIGLFFMKIIQHHHDFFCYVYTPFASCNFDIIQMNITFSGIVSIHITQYYRQNNTQRILRKKIEENLSLTLIFHRIFSLALNDFYWQSKCIYIFPCTNLMIFLFNKVWAVKVVLMQQQQLKKRGTWSWHWTNLLLLII